MASQLNTSPPTMKFVRSDKSEEELRAQLLVDFGEIFPEYEMVLKAGSETAPRKRLTVIDGTNETS
jgi:hypothetical protein